MNNRRGVAFDIVASCVRLLYIFNIEGNYIKNTESPDPAGSMAVQYRNYLLCLLGQFLFTAVSGKRIVIPTKNFRSRIFFLFFDLIPIPTFRFIVIYYIPTVLLSLQSPPLGDFLFFVFFTFRRVTVKNERFH